ncbi:MAG: HAD-IA family hydrolase [Phycisphaerales bacterium]
MSASIRVACFDLGGVVVRICRTFEEAVLSSGVPLRHAPDDKAWMARARGLMDAHQLGQLSGESFHRAMSDALSGLYTPQEFERIHAAVTRDAYANIESTIRAIRAAGIVTACLSNTNDDHWRVLVEMPALKALDHRFASHLWGVAKPNEAIYRRFERELGVRGDEIVFFDDLPENVAAAGALGWDALLIDHAGDTASQVTAALRARGITLA